MIMKKAAIAAAVVLVLVGCGGHKVPVAQRGLVTQAIKRFKGINRFRTATQTGPEWAIDLRNVIVHRHGGVEKLRVPVAISNVLGGLSTGPSSFFDYQRADGTRQVIAMEGTRIYRFTGVPLVGLEIDNNAGNAGTWSAVQSNNLLFMANGTRMLKWDGTNLQGWGIVAPITAPVFSVSRNIVTAVRTANVVTLTSAAVAPDYPLIPRVGDIIAVTGVVDSSFNGNFIVASVPSSIVVTYNQTAGDASSNGGDFEFFGATQSYAIDPVGIPGLSRVGSVVTIDTTLDNPFQVGDQIEITGASDASFNGTFVVLTKPNNQQSTHTQIGADATSGDGTMRGLLNAVDGIRYRYSYVNSVTGHVGPPSPPSVLSILGSFMRFKSTPVVSADAQVDNMRWTRTIDGGGDYFFVVDILDSVDSGRLDDGRADILLNKGIRAQFLNEPPPVGFFLAKSAGRIFVLRLASARHDIAYSGYERILDGRPEEAFPPSNRLRLAIGADEIRGGGVIQAGIIAFSKSNEMFMYRGIPEDVTTDEPIAFAAILEQLPWDIGSASGHAIKSTPYGLAWYGADNKVYVYNGEGEPIDMSEGIYPLLRQVTPSARANSRAAFFRWLESDWYALLVPVNGSATLNRIFLFDMTNDESNVGILVLDIAADSIGIIETADGDRRLVIGQGGLLKELAVGSYTDLGITTTPSGTSDTLAAWYRTGYFGNETPQAMKMWRFINTVVDQGGFRQDLYFVDRSSTLLNPLIITGNEVIGEQVVANRKAKRMSVLTNFPGDDVTAAMLEMSVSHIPVSER